MQHAETVYKEPDKLKLLDSFKDLDDNWNSTELKALMGLS